MTVNRVKPLLLTDYLIEVKLITDEALHGLSDIYVIENDGTIIVGSKKNFLNRKE